MSTTNPKVLRCPDCGLHHWGWGSCHNCEDGPPPDLLNRLRDAGAQMWGDVSHVLLVLDAADALDRTEARAAEWKAMAERLAHELSNWGYGDMHYGPMPRDAGVVSVLAAFDALGARDADEEGGT